jgi:hypothetical protein
MVGIVVRPRTENEQLRGAGCSGQVSVERRGWLGSLHVCPAETLLLRLPAAVYGRVVVPPQGHEWARADATGVHGA